MTMTLKSQSKKNLTRLKIFFKWKWSIRTTIYYWLNDNCYDVDFVLKIDDDVYINSCNSAIALAKLPPVEDKIYAFIKFSLLLPRRAQNL